MDSNIEMSAAAIDTGKALCHYCQRGELTMKAVERDDCQWNVVDAKFSESVNDGLPFFKEISEVQQIRYS
jgi:hypothetical protein